VTELTVNQIKEGNTTVIVFGGLVMCRIPGPAARTMRWERAAGGHPGGVCVLGSAGGGAVHAPQSFNIFVRRPGVLLGGLACKERTHPIVEFAPGAATREG